MKHHSSTAAPTSDDRSMRLYTLRLTADELDWLLGEILDDAARRFRLAGQPSNALDVEGVVKMWTAEVAKQGYSLAPCRR